MSVFGVSSLVLSLGFTLRNPWPAVLQFAVQLLLEDKPALAIDILLKRLSTLKLVLPQASTKSTICIQPCQIIHLIPKPLLATLGN